MKKHLALLMAGILLVGGLCLFSACSSQKPVKTTESTADPNLPPQLEFELDRNGEFYEVVGLGTYRDTDVVIPDTYEGLPVTRIGGGFQNCKQITSITIPGSIETVWGFQGCTGLTKVTLKEGTLEIGMSAFEGCTSLTTVELPEGLTIIEQNAFQGCTQLENVHFPRSLTTIKSGAFGDCEKLIEVEDGITYLCNWAIACDASVTEVTLREGTERLHDGIFSYCSELKSVTVPDSVRVIGAKVFERCSSLRTIVLGVGIEKIDWAILEYCSAYSMEYKGTMEQWQAIVKDSEWICTYSRSYEIVITCTDGVLME